MGNFLLAYDNRANDASLTSGSWSASRVRDNLKDQRLRKVARTTDALATSTLLRFGFNYDVYMQVLALIATNCTVNATYRWRTFTNGSFTTVVYDSGTLDLYPAGSMPASEIPVGAANYGTTKPLPEDARRWQNNIVHQVTAPHHARYVELQITDTANPAGYIEAGRLFVGKAFQPGRNFAHGDVSLRLASRTRQARARDGTRYFVDERPDFSLPVAFKWLTEHEAMRLLDLQAIVGTTGEVLAMWNPDEPAYWWRRQIFGNLRELDPIEYPRFATYAAAFQVEGTL